MSIEKNSKHVMKPYHKLADSNVSNDLHNSLTNVRIHGERDIKPMVLLLPLKIRTAYGINNISANGAGQTIAIIDAYAYPTETIQSNLNTFCAQFGIPTTTIVSKIMTNSAGNLPTANSDWGLEISLDIQWAHAIAPGATILMIQAYSASFTDMMAAVDYAINNNATIVSMSWGSNEFRLQTIYDSRFKKLNNKGDNIVHLASSGDVGGIVSWPSSSNNIIAVGGTTLNVDINGNRTSETGWNGSGGGISLVESMQSFQRNYGITGNKRQVPDVSFVADPNTGVPVYDNGTWYQVGGTSLSAPCYAGIIAIANQIRSNSRKTLLTTNSVLTYMYGTKKSGKYTSDFFDVISGTAGRHTAKINYDNVTGLGSPKIAVSTGIIIDLAKL